MLCQLLGHMTWHFFSFQTPDAHTTENSNWDIIEEKEKINSEETAQWDETRKTFHVFKQIWSVTHSPSIEKNSVTIIPWKEHMTTPQT